MGNIDSLTELANTLDVFFKGLSECNLLTTYSLQLQATAVDSPVEGKFQFLVREFMKNLQALLVKFPHEPVQDLGYNVGTQTDCPTNYIELKPVDPIIHEASPVVSYILDQQTWDEAKLHSGSEIIVSCDPESLAAITRPNSPPSESLTANTGPKSPPSESLTDITEPKSPPSESLTDITGPKSPPSESLTDITGPNSPPSGSLTTNTEPKSPPRESVTVITGQNSPPPITGHNSPPPESVTVITGSSPLGATQFVAATSIDEPEEVSSSQPTSDDVTDETASVTAIFICELCDKTFHTPRSLSQHLSVKHRSRGQCDMCEQKFPSLQSLQEHCRSVHHGSGCFTCAVCGRRFMTRLSYSRHLDTHSGNKGAVCDICGKLLSRADYLQQHYMTHNGARPHACTTCPRRFVSAGQLKVHQRTHTGLKDHVCDRCNKAFSRTDKLKEHLLRHMAIKRFACGMCERTYAEKRDLNKHMKVHVAKNMSSI